MTPVPASTGTSATPSQAQAALANGNGNGNGKGPAPPTSPHIDYTRFISRYAQSFPPSAIRALFKAETVPGMVSFLAGKPNPATFPVQSMSVTLKAHEEEGIAEPVTLEIDSKDLEDSLQYGSTSGLPKLNKWLEDLTTTLHGREVVQPQGEQDPRTEWRVTIGTGVQDLLSKTFSVLLNPHDSILVEAPCYR